MRKRSLFLPLKKKKKSRTYYDTRQKAGILYDDNILSWIATVSNGVGSTELQNSACYFDLGTQSGVKRKYHPF